MKKKLFIILFLLFIIFFASAQETPIITVLDFETETFSKAEMKTIISLISSGLFKSGEYTVIDVSERDLLLNELEFSLSDCADESCQLEVGKLLSAEMIVTGSLTRFGSRVVLSAKVLETGTGRTLNTADGIYDNVNALLDNIIHFSDELGRVSSVPVKTDRTVEETIEERDYVSPIDYKEMVPVKAGSFLMGSATGDEDEQPVHLVRLSKDYYIGRYEVTVDQFREFIDATGYTTVVEKGGGAWLYTGSNWAQPADALWNNPYFEQGPNEPVTCVSWYDAVEFCNWLSKKEGYERCYSGEGDLIQCNFDADGFRLPTEAEWEYAARGGHKNKGFTYSGFTDSEVIYLFANFSDVNANYQHPDNTQDDGYSFTAPVGSYRPNEIGLHDMCGNVNEFCWDLYDNGYYKNSPSTDPTGAVSGSVRTTRGGNFYSDATLLRIAKRVEEVPTTGSPLTGIRLVRTSMIGDLEKKYKAKRAELSIELDGLKDKRQQAYDALQGVDSAIIGTTLHIKKTDTSDLYLKIAELNSKIEMLEGSGAPELISPANGELISTSDYLRWSGNVNAKFYHIQIAAVKETSGNKMYEFSSKDLVYEDKEHMWNYVYADSLPVKIGTTYYWRTRTNFDSGSSPWSETRSFMFLHSSSWKSINKSLESHGLDLRLVPIILAGDRDTYRDMTLTAYALSATEVTQGDFNKVSVSTGEVNNRGLNDNYPMYNVTWYQAAEFCNNLSTLCGLEKVYNEMNYGADFTKNGFYLPTEAQWEFAAGGPHHYKWSLGNTFNAADYVFNDNQSRPVKSHPANGFGLFDMSGNVLEWCHDNYGEVYPYKGDIDPTGPGWGANHVARGGGWDDTDSGTLATGSRHGTTGYGSGLGFRVAAGGFNHWH
jgi:formylglycine-generating enzyme